MAMVLESAKSDLLKASNTDLLPRHRVRVTADSTSASRTRLELKLPKSEQSTRNMRQLHSGMKDSHLSDRLDPTSRTKNASQQLSHSMDVSSTPTVGAVDSEDSDDVGLPLLLPEDPFCEIVFSRDMNRVFPQPSAPNTSTSFISYLLYYKYSNCSITVTSVELLYMSFAILLCNEWVTSNAGVMIMISMIS